MENPGKTQVTTNLQDAQGYSARENAKYMDTLTAKMNELVTSLKELAVQLGDAGIGYSEMANQQLQWCAEQLKT